MDDLISRQAAIDALNCCQTFLYDSHDKYPKIELEDAKAEIESLPTVEPRKGRWSIEDCHAATYKYCCSECKAHHRARYDYCPTCGAKMEGDE
jgi:hypothetical protein